MCRHFDGSQHVFQWHAYTFDLPPGAVADDDEPEFDEEEPVPVEDDPAQLSLL